MLLLIHKPCQIQSSSVIFQWVEISPQQFFPPFLHILRLACLAPDVQKFIKKGAYNSSESYLL